MKCPACGHNEDKVLESRSMQSGEITRRRRECFKCKHRYTTHERIEEQAILVRKRSGLKELFNGKKILKGLIRAFEKRPFEIKDMENLVFEIEQDLRDRKVLEIPSDHIGTLILDKLQTIDQVAYIRFASVYRKFNTAQEFTNEVNQFLKEKEFTDENTHTR